MVLVYVDTNVFVHALEEKQEGGAGILARRLIRAAADGKLDAVTSELTLAEVLAPNKRHAGALPTMLKRAYLDLIVHGGFIGLEALVREDMYESAKLRSWQKAKVGLPDVLHLATAIRTNADVFATNDKAISTPQGMKKLDLSSRGIGALLTELGS